MSRTLIGTIISRLTRSNRFVFIHLNRNLALDLGKGIVFGRTQGHETFPYDDLLSKQHMKIHIRGDRVFVEDLKTTNGTFVNGKVVETKHLVEIFHGDEVRVGSQKFQFRDLSSKEGLGRRSGKRPMAQALRNLLHAFIVGALCLILPFAVNNMGVVNDLKAILSDEVITTINTIEDAFVGGIAIQTCTIYEETRLLQCFRKRVSELDEKAVGPVVYYAMFKLNFDLARRELQKPELFQNQRTSISIDALDNAIFIMEKTLKTPHYSRMSFVIGDHFSNSALANAVAREKAQIEQLFQMIAQEIEQKGSEIQESEKTYFSDLMKKYTGLKDAIEDALKESILDRMFWGLVAPKLGAQKIFD